MAVTVIQKGGGKSALYKSTYVAVDAGGNLSLILERVDREPSTFSFLWGLFTYDYVRTTRTKTIVAVYAAGQWESIYTAGAFLDIPGDQSCADGKI